MAAAWHTQVQRHSASGTVEGPAASDSRRTCRLPVHSTFADGNRPVWRGFVRLLSSPEGRSRTVHFLETADRWTPKEGLLRPRLQASSQTGMKAQHSLIPLWEYFVGVMLVQKSYREVRWIESARSGAPKTPARSGNIFENVVSGFADEFRYARPRGARPASRSAVPRLHGRARELSADGVVHGVGRAALVAKTRLGRKLTLRVENDNSQEERPFHERGKIRLANQTSVTAVRESDMDSTSKKLVTRTEIVNLASMGMWTIISRRKLTAKPEEVRPAVRATLAAASSLLSVWDWRTIFLRSLAAKSPGKSGTSALGAAGAHFFLNIAASKKRWAIGKAKPSTR